MVNTTGADEPIEGFRVISRDQKHAIHLNAWSFEHDYRVHGAYLGEPYEHDGVIYYFDGDTLFLVCHRLPPATAPLDECSAAILGSVVAQQTPARILALGEQLPSTPAFSHLGYALSFEEDVDPSYAELCVHFNDERSSARLSRRIKESRARCRSASLQATIAGGDLEWQHVALLRSFATQIAPDFGSRDLSYFLLVPQRIAQLDGAFRIDVFDGDRLVGFAQVVVSSIRFAVLHTVVWNRARKYVCDALYAEALDKLRTMGIGACSLGATIDGGLLRYKAKWGGEPTAWPRYKAWVHEACPNPERQDVVHWPTQIVERYLTATC